MLVPCIDLFLFVGLGFVNRVCLCLQRVCSAKLHTITSLLSLLKENSMPFVCLFPQKRVRSTYRFCLFSDSLKVFMRPPSIIVYFREIFGKRQNSGSGFLKGICIFLMYLFNKRSIWVLAQLHRSFSCQNRQSIFLLGLIKPFI